MRKQHFREPGFTLIELMIVIAIIGILATVAVPAYQTFVKKARFVEVVNAAALVRSAIDICFAIKGPGSLPDCDTEAELGLYLSDAEEPPLVDTVTLTLTTAEITATGTAAVDAQTYILTPTESNNNLQWTQSGSCIASGLC